MVSRGTRSILEVMKVRTCPGGRWGGIAVGIIFWIVGAVVLSVTLWGDHGVGMTVFLSSWVVGAAACGFSILFRQALELRLGAGRVEAVYAFRTRRLAISRLRAMRPSRGGLSRAVIEVLDEPPILVAGQGRLDDFAAALNETAPALSITLPTLIRPRS